MKAKAQGNVNLLTASPGKAILIFAIPIILGNLFQQFYNMVDAVIASHFIGENALAAIGSSYAITNVFIAVAVGGSIGSAVIISQYWGAGDMAKSRTSITTLLCNFIVTGVVLGIVGLLTSSIFLKSLNTPDNVITDAKIYLDTYFWGLPFLFLYNACAAILNSLGDSKTPLKLLIFSSILNIILDLLFVVAFKNGVAGVAYATLVAQGFSSLCALYVLYRKTRHLPAETGFYAFDITSRMVKVAIPSIVQQSIVNIGMLLVQSVVNSFGAAVLAGYSAGMRFEAICVIPMIALGNAMSTFTAQNIGADQLDRVRQGYRSAYWIVGGISVFLLAGLHLFGNPLMKAFLGSEGASGAVFDIGLEYLYFLAFFYGLIGLKSITDGVLRGAGDVSVFTLANLVNLAIRVWFAMTFAPSMGVSAVWIAIPMGWTANYLISFVWYLMGRWKQKKLIYA